MTVQFGPSGDGCGEPLFTPTAAYAAGLQFLPSIVGSGSEDFVIPRVLATPSAHTGATGRPAPTCSRSPAIQRMIRPPRSPCPSPSRSPRPSRHGLSAWPPRWTAAGYWLVQSGGGVFSYGDAAFYGSLPGLGTSRPTRSWGWPPPPTGRAIGWWLRTEAYSVSVTARLPRFHGQPAARPAGGGYGLHAQRQRLLGGGRRRKRLCLRRCPLFGGLRLQPNQPVVGIASTADGKGYWEVAADGGIFSFGDAQFRARWPASPSTSPSWA